MRLTATATTVLTTAALGVGGVTLAQQIADPADAAGIAGYLDTMF